MSKKLTKEIIKSRANEDKIETIKTLNLWGNKLEDISLLKELPLLEILSLSSNHIHDLSVFQNLKNIKELYLRENLINDFKQIEYLKYCKKLEILSLTDNPITKQQNYRQKILEILPHLKKLDEQDNILDKNPPPPSSFGLFKKIFPKRTNINDKNKNENNENNIININKNNNFISSYNSKKNNILNKSFQKKNTIGTFRKTDNKKDGNFNLDLSVDLSKIPMSLKNADKTINNNLGNKQMAMDHKNNNNLTDSVIANKYNKKIAGNFKKERCTLFKYQEFDEPKNNNQKIENKPNKQKIENNKINNKNNNIKNEETVLKSIKLLLETLNMKELNIVNDEVKKMIEKQNK